MLERALKYLDEKHVCPHCKKELTLCHAPPIHVGDGLGWGSEFLFICLNDECSLFVNGWKFVEEQYGHVGSYRHMEIPNSNESYNMMVAGRGAYTGNVVDVEALRQQNTRYRAEKDAVARLENCLETHDLEAVLYLLTDNAATLDNRKHAAEMLVPLNDIECIEPLRNHDFGDSHLEQNVNMAISTILAAHFLRECPYCAELVKARAKICKHCKEDLSDV